MYKKGNFTNKASYWVFFVSPGVFGSLDLTSGDVFLRLFWNKENLLYLLQQQFEVKSIV